MAELVLESFEKMTAAFSDPYYLHVIKPDEVNFLDSTSTEVIAATTMGISKPIVLDGNAVVDTTKTMTVWREWENKSKE